MGAGVSFVPGFLSVLGESSAWAAVFGGGEYPIGLWWPPPPGQTTVGRYREISDAGFNFVIGGNGVTDNATNPPALEAAAANGLRFVLTDRKLQNIIRDSAAGTRAAGTHAAGTPSVMRFLIEQEERETPQPEVRAAAEPRAAVRQRIQELAALYGDNPALAGFSLYDEPGRNLSGILGYARRTLRELAPGELSYVNAWPSYAAPSALGTRTYPEYVDRYMDVIRPPVLSFDHYPLLADGRTTSDYFYNWAVIRRYSLRYGVPSWTFIQSLGFDGSEAGLPKRRSPDEADLLWQVNVGLAYGAKGIQYFTYWTPETGQNSSIRFGPALISASGSRTPRYRHATEVNRYLRVVGKALLDFSSESVTHARERRPPRGVEVFRRDGYIKAVYGDPVIMGRFRNPATAPSRRLLVVNRSPENAAKTGLTLAENVRGVYKLNSWTGRFERVRPSRTRAGRVVWMRIPPGGARLFLLRPR